jgi:phosphoribosylformylglycinamidine synthase subunit PurQ / glutaminase
VRVAVLRFPGSNCDQDALHALRGLGLGADYVWHEETSLAGFDGVFVPGGFSYGDYLRCGAMASRAAVMDAVRERAAAGAPVLGACNGFQILCEAGLLPGALMRNVERRFVCASAPLTPVNRTSRWTRDVGETLALPVAHGEGRYVADDATLDLLESQDRVAFRYAGHLNGSARDVAGVLNEAGNVLGLMPHPERAANPLLGSTDGVAILRGFVVED